jgi:hypothetical protein
MTLLGARHVARPYFAREGQGKLFMELEQVIIAVHRHIRAGDAVVRGGGRITRITEHARLPPLS